MFHIACLRRKILPILGVIILTSVPLSNAQARHGGFGHHFGGGLGAGLGAGIGYGIANYGIHRAFGGYHPHYYPPRPYYGGYRYGYETPQTHITIVNQAPPAPPSSVPAYPYPVPGYTHYQPGSGYTAAPQITYVPGYGNAPVSTPITP